MADDHRDLQALREAIEDVDRQIMALFKSRMRLAESVASVKIGAAYPFRDQLREEQVLQRVRRAATEMDLDAHQIEQIYRQIMHMSLGHQLAHLKHAAPGALRVAYQGVEGSYSHLTAQRHYRDRAGGVLLSGFDSFRAAADSVVDGSVDVALLPIQNSTAGSINDTYDLLAEGRLTIIAEVISQISHCLLGMPGATVPDLRVILSHPQALGQCERFLRSVPHARPQAEFDTAGSARKVKEARDRTIAAIASESAARVFGLAVLARDIQNERGNYTRFVEVATEAARCPSDAPCKTSLLLATGHRPGDLADVLRHFASRSINLTKLESRPIPDRPFQYRFYLDIEGHALSAPVSEALAAIEPHTRELRVLGTYPRAALDEAQAADHVTATATATATATPPVPASAPDATPGSDPAPDAPGSEP